MATALQPLDVIKFNGTNYLLYKDGEHNTYIYCPNESARATVIKIDENTAQKVLESYINGDPEITELLNDSSLTSIPEPTSLQRGYSQVHPYSVTQQQTVSNNSYNGQETYQLASTSSVNLDSNRNDPEIRSVVRTRRTPQLRMAPGRFRQVTPSAQLPRLRSVTAFRRPLQRNQGVRSQNLTTESQGAQLQDAAVNQEAEVEVLPGEQISNRQSQPLAMMNYQRPQYAVIEQQSSQQNIVQNFQSTSRLQQQNQQNFQSTSRLQQQNQLRPPPPYVVRAPQTRNLTLQQIPGQVVSLQGKKFLLVRMKGNEN